MKAMTISQPWAQLIARGYKFIETRSWSTPYRGPLAIHAASEMLKGAPLVAIRETDAGRLGPEMPLGAIVAVGILADCQPVEILLEQGLVTQLERSLGNFNEGRFGFVFDCIAPLAAPIFCRGALSLWEWTPPASYTDPQC